MDFFPPVVDDPYSFGQIAAANALSDIYAMGGEPRLAMNLLCFPSCLDLQYVRAILEGGQNKVEEAGAVIAGTLVAPHAVCAGVAAIFNALAWALSSRPFALTSGILYAVSMVLFPMYFMFVIIQTVLSFVGFARLPKTA